MAQSADNSGIIGKSKAWFDVLTRARFIRFGMVAGFSGAVYFVAVFIFSEFAGISPGLASALAYCAAIPANFVGQKLFTFRSTNKPIAEIGPYLLLQGVNIAISGLTMSVLVNQLGAPVLVGGAGVILTISVVSYLSMAIIFSNRPRSTSRQSGGER
jgi:putative flippase GtrA